MNGNKRLQTALILLLAGAGGLNAQMYMSQEGHLLDANNRVGSYGRNTSVPLDVLVPRGDLYITGNISSGARFQGVVPYRSNYEMGSVLGSGSLSNFRRDSVGSENLGTHQLGPMPYLDPSRSVTTSYGGNVINTSQSFGQLVSPVGAGMGQTQRVNPYLREDLMVRPLSRSYSPLNAGSSGNLPQLDMFSGYTPTPRRAPALPNAENAQPLGGIPYQLPKLRPDRMETGKRELTTEAPAATAETESTTITPFEEQIQVEQWDRQAQTQMKQQVAPEDSDKESPESSPAVVTPPGGSRPATALTNRMPAPPTVGKGSLRAPAMSHAQMQQQAAGQHLEQGQELMRQKHYYRAADQFDTAALYAGHDPLVFAAKTQALFGAGEYMSSAYFLTQMLSRTDTLKGLGAEVTCLWSDSETVQKRLAEIIRWYEQSKKPMLLFLKGYVEYCTGQTEQAKTTLTQAQQDMPEEPLVQKLLTLVGGPAAG